MAFQKGKSGNPGGKAKTVLPDGRTLAEVAREHTVQAIETLVEVMTEGDSDTARAGAANSILDRGWGRPQQSVDIGFTEETMDWLERARRAREASNAK